MAYRHIFTLIIVAFFTNAIAHSQDFPNKKTALQVLEQAERTIGNPLSSEHNEEKYLNVLKLVCTSEQLSDFDKQRPVLLLADALKNRVGSKAADIEYITPSSNNTLHIYDIKAPLTLIYFNDPDCEACEMVKSRLDTCSTLKSLAENNKIEIVGIYTQSDEQAWRNAKFPTFIINGWNKNQEIENTETYTLPTLPLFYLLDADKKVLLKAEASLNKVINYLLTDNIK